MLLNFSWSVLPFMLMLQSVLGFYIGSDYVNITKVEAYFDTYKTISYDAQIDAIMHQPVKVNGTDMLLVDFIIDYMTYHSYEEIDTYQLDEVTGWNRIPDSLPDNGVSIKYKHPEKQVVNVFLTSDSNEGCIGSGGVDKSAEPVLESCPDVSA